MFVKLISDDPEEFSFWYFENYFCVKSWILSDSGLFKVEAAGQTIRFNQAHWVFIVTTSNQKWYYCFCYFEMFRSRLYELRQSRSTFNMTGLTAEQNMDPFWSSTDKLNREVFWQIETSQSTHFSFAFLFSSRWRWASRRDSGVNEHGVFQNSLSCCSSSRSGLFTFSSTSWFSLFSSNTGLQRKEVL